jgi:hypothetical protein
MTCSWCNGDISILRALTDWHYCCSEHREYAKMSALHSEEVQGSDARRRHRRYSVDGGVLQVSWLDVNGCMKSTRSRVLNISEDGIALQLPDAVMPLLVRFRSDQLKIEGVGVVRQCRRTGNKYLVGLEFTEGLHWRAPEADVQEPVPLCEPGI